jgi:chemotaxis protein histidine kinase CheA
MGTPGTLSGRLLDLRHRFMKTMDDRVMAINETMARCGRNDLTAVGELERQFHTLAGTAGTYGLLTVAAAASEAEEVCAEFGDAPMNGETFRYLQDVVENLRSAVAQSSANQSGVEAA